MNPGFPLCWSAGILLCLATLPNMATAESDTLAIVISGFGSDASPGQLAGKVRRGRGNSGMFQLLGDLKQAGWNAKFFNWNGNPAGQFKKSPAGGSKGIADYIRQQHAASPIRHLVIVGHSWGGHTLLEVADQLQQQPRIDIAMAVGVDPSSLSRGERPPKLPATIARFVNYHTRNTFVWGAWKDANRIHNIDLGRPGSGFKARHGNYAAKFDIRAHNAAEWDEHIHGDIVKRVKQLTAKTANTANAQPQNPPVTAE